MVLDEEDLPDSGHEEEEDVDDGHGEDCFVEVADIVEVTCAWCLFVGWCCAERSVDNAAVAVICAVSSVVGNGGEAACEQDVEDDGEEGEESNASQADREEDAEDGVQNGCTAHALNCFLPCWDVEVFV